MEMEMEPLGMRRRSIFQNIRGFSTMGMGLDVV
jgi:hypothetical protein